MMTYIIAMYIIAFLREGIVIYRTGQSMSPASALILLGAPIMFPIVLIGLIIISYKEVKNGKLWYKRKAKMFW